MNNYTNTKLNKNISKGGGGEKDLNTLRVFEAFA